MSEAFIWPQFGSARVAEIPPEQVRAQAEAEGRTAGFERGRADAVAAARTETAALREQLSQALARLENHVAESRTAHMDALARTAHELCRRVVGVELRTTTGAFEHVLAEAVAQMDETSQRTEVCLNPEDHAWFREHYDGDLALHPDPDVPPCGVSIRQPAQALDYDPLALIDRAFAAFGADAAADAAADAGAESNRGGDHGN